MRSLPPVAVLLVAMAVALSGCAADSGPDLPSASDVASGLHHVPWGLDSCTFLIGFAQVDADVLAAHLPDGFTPAPGLLPGAGPVLGIEAFTCNDGLGLDGQPVGPLPYGSFFASVAPPEELRLDGTDTYWVKWDTLVPDAPRREALAAAGLPARDGRTLLSNDAGLQTATLELDGVGTFTVTGRAVTPATTSPGPGYFAEFTPTAGGLARWNASAMDSTTSLGVGAVTVPAGSLAATLLGAETAPATVMAGSWSFTAGQTVLRIR